MPEAPHDDHERADLELVPKPNPAGWRRERIGWALLAALIAAALIGVFGAGPLSRTSVSAGEVYLDYDRFVRTSAATALQVTLPTAANEAGEAIVTLDHDYLDRIRLDNVLPEPKRTIARPGTVEFVFATASDGRPVVAWFHLTLETPGLARARLTAAGETLAFWQLAYP
jgi:hypothetical protein